MPMRPATAKYMHTRASGAVKRASKSRSFVAKRLRMTAASLRSIHRLDAPDHVLQAGIGDELVVHGLHRVLERFLVDRDDLRAGALDDLARFVLALVPQLAHVWNRFLRRLPDDLLVIGDERVPDFLREQHDLRRERMLGDRIELGRLEVPRGLV